MSIRVENSPKKKAAIEAALNKPFEIGERIEVKRNSVSGYNFASDEGKSYTAKIVKVVDANTLDVVLVDAGRNIETQVKQIKIDVDLTGRFDLLFRAGANPIVENETNLRYISYSFESILSVCGFNEDDIDNIRKPYYIDDANKYRICEFNWNPYIYDKNGIKQYYQRDFVWSLEDNQLLVESVYNGMDCGRILVRKHSWESLKNRFKAGETELYFFEIVDGKQRLNAMFRFFRNEYPDLHGNYYNDLSNYAQYKLTNHQQFSFAEMDEGCTDAEVIKQFLKVNFTGRVMSKEHIDYVRSLNI